MKDTGLKCGWPNGELTMVKAPGPSFNFSGPRKDSGKLIRRQKGKKSSMNLDSFGARPLFPNTPTFDRSRDDSIIRFPNSIVNSIDLFRFVCWKLYSPLPPAGLHDDPSLRRPGGLSDLSFSAIPFDSSLLRLRKLKLLYLSNCQIQIQHPRQIRENVANVSVSVQHPRQIRENVANVSVSAEWMFLLASLCLEIVSAVFEQVSSPRKPHFALTAMLLAILALLACITELFLKARKERVRLVRSRGRLPLFYHPPPRNRLFGTFSDVFGLLGVFLQLAFSIVQYAYLRRHVDNPIKVCFWPFLLIFCVAGSILIRNRRNTEDRHEAGEHSA